MSRTDMVRVQCFMKQTPSGDSALTESMTHTYGPMTRESAESLIASLAVDSHMWTRIEIVDV